MNEFTCNSKHVKGKIYWQKLSKLKVKKKNHKTTVKSKAQVHRFFIALFKWKSIMNDWIFSFKSSPPTTSKTSENVKNWKSSRLCDAINDMALPYGASQSNTWTHGDAFLTRALVELETVEENRHKWLMIRLWLGSRAFPRLFVIFVLWAAISQFSLFSVALEHVVGPLGAAAAFANNEGAPAAGKIASAAPPSVHPLHLPFLVPVVMLQLDEREVNWNSPIGHHAAYSVPKLRTYTGRDCLSDMRSNQPPVLLA